MTMEIKTPVLPESVSDATIATWHKKEGDAVRRGENLMDLETDKVVLEVPAPENGVLSSILAPEGATVVAGQALALLEPGKAPAATPPPATGADDAGGTNDAGADDADSDALSPAVRRLLQQHNINPANIRGSGKDGRILKEDVLLYFQQQVTPAMGKNLNDGALAAGERHADGVIPQPVIEKPAAPADGATPAPVPTPVPGSRDERREPLSRIRQTIARRLLEAQHKAAILSTFNEVNLTAVLELRKRYGEDFEKRHGARLGLMSFFVKACVEGLRQFPALNAYVEDNQIVYHDYCDVGIAVASPRGLVVPVIRNAETLSFAGIELQVRSYGKQAADGSLDINDLGGGTFSITNGGVFGSLLSTPIINPPQSAILGMHTIQQRPVAEDGAVVIRPMMYLALSYDHRIIDGREAVQFLVTVKTALEEPQRMLLGL